MKRRPRFVMASFVLNLTLIQFVSGADLQFIGSAPPPAEPLSLWYRQPATRWTEALPIGNVTGLRARGGFEVDLAWNGRRLTDAKIKSVGGHDTTIRYDNRTTEIKLKFGEAIQLNSELQPTTNFLKVR